MRIPVYFVLVFVTGLIIGIIGFSAPESEETQLQTDPEPETATTPLPQEGGLPLEFTVRQLQKVLDEEIQQRKKLSQQITALQKQVKSLQGTQNAESQDTQDPGTISINTLDNSSDLVDETTRQQQTLLALGLDQAAIERLNQRREKREMDELYLRNKSVREGWFQTEKYALERRKITNTNIYREEMGDELYDKYLYDTGQFNRVEVQSVLTGSPAEKVGLSDGDIIYRYDGERIYGWTDLTNATAQGDPNQTVKVEVLRNGETVDVYMQRGPLGIRINSNRINPAN